MPAVLPPRWPVDRMLRTATSSLRCTPPLLLRRQQLSVGAESAAATAAAAALELQDAGLLQTGCFVNGEWTQGERWACSGRIDVVDPGAFQRLLCSAVRATPCSSDACVA